MYRPPCGHRNSLRVRQKYTLNAKILLSKTTIEQWHKYWRGDVGIDYDENKDTSTVLLHLVHSIFPEVPAIPASGDRIHRHPYLDTLILDDPYLLDEFERLGNNTPFASKPLATWLEKDIKEYIERFDLK